MIEQVIPLARDAGLSKAVPGMIARYGFEQTAIYLRDYGVSLDDAYFMIFGKRPKDGDIFLK